MKERIRKCGGRWEKADDEESKKLNSQHNGGIERGREGGVAAEQWMMVVGGSVLAALCQSSPVVFSVAYK